MSQEASSLKHGNRHKLVPGNNGRTDRHGKDPGSTLQPAERVPDSR